jgi:chemotaxis protein methyltransferase CheR
MRVPFTDEEYRLISEFLVQEYGLWFGPERREILRTRLEPRRAELGLRNFHELFFHLKFHPEREDERSRLIPHLTNNESYFFRERTQLEHLRDVLLPEIAAEAEATGRDELRLLSAGCSAGQEPYSLAMLIEESGLKDRFRFHITGVDLDPMVLDLARAGRYTTHSFRGVAEEVRDRWFSENDGAWQLDRRILDRVDFRTANLADAEWARGLPPQDVVFCRNVLIYFDADALRRAAQGLHSALAPGGRLFLGHAESLSRVPTPLVAQRRPGVIYYRKPSGPDANTVAGSAHSEREAHR